VRDPVVLFYGFLFYDFGKNRPDAMTPIREWFAPKWERFWTLTPYDRLVLGLPVDDTAERLELKTVKEMAYRPPEEMDVYWQRSSFVRACSGQPGRIALLTGAHRRWWRHPSGRTVWRYQAHRSDLGSPTFRAPLMAHT
jgi:hypothetical protein